MPAVIDGFISAVAALCACRLNPLAAAYMIPSHASAEKGYRLAMEAMGLEPMLLMNMRLGEGSGCPIAFELVAASQSVLRDMATFAEAAIDDGLMDVVIVDDIPKYGIPRAFVRLMKRQILQLPTTCFRRTARLRLESDRPMPIQIDGEIHTELPFDVRVVFGSLRVYRP